MVCEGKPPRQLKGREAFLRIIIKVWCNFCGDSMAGPTPCDLVWVMTGFKGIRRKSVEL